MTPDHLHGYISVAAMKKGKHVVIHKPLANRMYEAKLVMKTAKETGSQHSFTCME
jgi:Predicted dehydrogenases and related proteins